MSVPKLRVYTFQGPNLKENYAEGCTNSNALQIVAHKCVLIFPRFEQWHQWGMFSAAILAFSFCKKKSFFFTSESWSFVSAPWVLRHSVWSLYVLPQTKNVRLTGDSKLPIGVSVSAWFVSVSRCPPPYVWSPPKVSLNSQHYSSEYL